MRGADFNANTCPDTILEREPESLLPMKGRMNGVIQDLRERYHIRKPSLICLL